MIFLFLASFSFVRGDDTLVPQWKKEVLKVKQFNDSLEISFLSNNVLFLEKWDTLAQPKFWKKVMTLPEDSCVINIAKNRVIVAEMSVEKWDAKSDEQKENYRDSIRLAHGLDTEDRIFMTSGKADFYAFDLVFPTITKGVEVFMENGVDPWYAQAILMIESPGKLAKSNAGAYGSFQLMASVARSHGLTVNKYVDERQDFVKSANAASSLIANTCIPEAKKILKNYNIAYKESDLWFRLFVLHIYHAGSANVSSVVKVINPSEGSGQLIQKMWQTEAGKFRNASQNYSQLALAAMLIFEEMILNSCEYIVEEEESIISG